MTHPAARPDPTSYGSLLDLLDEAAERGGDRPLMALRGEEGLELHWSARELLRRSLLVAWRLRELGLRPGDRLLTWSPSTPQLPAVYFGAMRAGVVVVPLDLRMAPDVVDRIAERSGARWLAVGTGRDAPDPGGWGLGGLQARTVAWLADDPAHESAPGSNGLVGDEGGGDVAFPDDWQAEVERWQRPERDDLFEVVFTSGTTGQPKGAMLSHGNMLASVEAIDRAIRPQQHRLVSLLPLSHLFEQAPTLFYGLMIGADVLYLRSRNPRIIFEALRDHRVTTMVLVPQVLELFYSALTREIERQGRTRSFERARAVARHLPYPLRRFLFRDLHRALGGELRLFVSAAAFLSPSLQQAWEELGVVVMQGYGATECGLATATSVEDHPSGTVGRPVSPVRLRLAPDDSEILVSGPSVFRGYWRAPEATAAALDSDGWYHTGDVGHFDKRGHLILSGRKRDIIVLANGLNVFPEDIENALRVAGLPDTVVLETRPGRIEVVVVAAQPELGRGDAERPALPLSEERRGQIERSIRTANNTLAVHQRIAGWRLWPGADFPRTHTLKIRGDRVRAWAAEDVPLPVREEVGAGRR